MSDNLFFKIPFAISGDREDIPQDIQKTGHLSFETGYSFDYERDPATDPNAKDIGRLEFNQLMFMMTSVLRQYQSQGVYPYITADQNGGTPFAYSKAARCLYDAGQGLAVFESLDNNNTALPIDNDKWRAVYDQWLSKSKNDVLEVIRKADLTPDLADFTQLYEAIQHLIRIATPDKYDTGQYYWFEDDLIRPGMFPCLGGVVQNISNYPQILEYLSTEHGAKRLVTQSEYDDLHVATWHTCADGTKIGWEGVGGVNKFVWNKENDTLRLPDLAGMMPEQIGFDGLGVGVVHGDAIRNIKGSFEEVLWVGNTLSGVIRTRKKGGRAIFGDGGYSKGIVDIDTSLAHPTAEKNQPRAWGSLACVYLGRPSQTQAELP